MREPARSEDHPARRRARALRLLILGAAALLLLGGLGIGGSLRDSEAACVLCAGPCLQTIHCYPGCVCKQRRCELPEAAQ